MRIRITCLTLAFVALLTGMVAAQEQRGPRDVVIEQKIRR